jgi:hypothetical protein
MEVDEMSTPAQPAQANEVAAFLEKLAQFHETLNPTEQALLDDMTTAALRASQADVQGYSLNFATIGPMLSNQSLTLAPYNQKPYYYYAQVSSIMRG